MDYKTFMVTRDAQIDNTYLEEYLDAQYEAHKRAIYAQARQTLLSTLKHAPAALFHASEVIVEHIAKA